MQNWFAHAKLQFLQLCLSIEIRQSMIIKYTLYIYSLYVNTNLKLRHAMRVALGGSLTRPKAALPPIIIGWEEAFLLRFVWRWHKNKQQSVRVCILYPLFIASRALWVRYTPTYSYTGVDFRHLANVHNMHKMIYKVYTRIYIIIETWALCADLDPLCRAIRSH